MMYNLESIVERIHESFTSRTSAREEALAQARSLIRHCANAIRAIHRDERELAHNELQTATSLASSLQKNQQTFPDIYFEGYTQDALKEFAEASIVYSLTENGTLPLPEELGIEYAAYLKGMAEAIGELRRRCLDTLRVNHTQEAEQMLAYMDDIFAILITMDYPDAITGGLRRLTDIARSIIERTRGDLTLSLRQENLEKSLHHLEQQLRSHPPQ